jgi:hypothetical protein
MWRSAKGRVRSVRRYIAFLAVALIVSVSCAAGRGRYGNPSVSWPTDKSFVVVDEVPDYAVSFRMDISAEFLPQGVALDRKNVASAISRVLILPVVENYLWKGKRHSLALVDPIVVHPGEQIIADTLSRLMKNGQYVRNCILLARGYCPGDLYSSPWHDVCEYKGKEAWLIEMTRLSNEDFQTAASIMVKELSGSSLHVRHTDRTLPPTFQEAIKEERILCQDMLRGPLVGKHGDRAMYLLWGVKHDADVSVCLSPEGLECVKSELLSFRGQDTK